MLPVRRQAGPGRSLGATGHRSVTELTRKYALRFVALGFALTLVAFPTTAGAQSAAEGTPADAAQRALDAAAQRWFEAQREADDLAARVAGIERDIERTKERVATARAVAAERASIMYQNASVGYVDVLAADPIETARRAHLIQGANSANESAIDELTASIEDLEARQDDLSEAKDRQEKALRDATGERDRLERELSVLRAEVARERAATAAAAPPSTTRPEAAAAPASPAAPPAPRVTAPGNGSTAGGGTSTGGGGSSGGGGHHDDPFLVCTRSRESGGVYTVVSADGRYHGAYQFLPSTWDATAAHAGRRDLVGVLPSRASVADQDDVAWALYQWQGKGPWGGLC